MRKERKGNMEAGMKKKINERNNREETMEKDKAVQRKKKEKGKRIRF